MTKEIKVEVETMRDDIKIAQENAVTLSSTAPEISNMLQVIAQCAKDPNIDISKMIALRDMRDQELARMKEEAFAFDYVQMKNELPRVIKSKDNTQTKSRYAPLEDINDVIDPILKKYGFATSTPVREQTENSVTVEAILIHKSGHRESCKVTMALDNKGPQGTVNKTLPHAISSSAMYARRGAVCALLNISTGDDRDGNDVDENGNPIQKKKSNFQDKVNADSKKNNKVSPKTENEEDKWDKKTIFLLNKKNIVLNFKNSAEAGIALLKELSAYETKKDRSDVVALNLGIMRALIAAKNGELITNIHKFADEGK